MTSQLIDVIDQLTNATCLWVGVVILLLLAVLQDSRELNIVEVSSLDGRLTVHVIHLHATQQNTCDVISSRSDVMKQHETHLVVREAVAHGC